MEFFQRCRRLGLAPLTSSITPQFRSPNFNHKAWIKPWYNFMEFFQRFRRLGLAPLTSPITSQFRSPSFNHNAWIKPWYDFMEHLLTCRGLGLAFLTDPLSSESYLPVKSTIMKFELGCQDQKSNVRTFDFFAKRPYN